MNKIRIGKTYIFEPATFDRLDRNANTPDSGTLVRTIKSPHGTPPFGTMGHCYVETLEGQFVGLVQLASLKEIAHVPKTGAKAHA